MHGEKALSISKIGNYKSIIYTFYTSPITLKSISTKMR